MRAGGCTVQQALTLEAANIVKQAVSLTKRRGHAQVTPLHVANTMLTSSTGLLRTACLQSHSHPLQCKALELCFNVALNRLPASSSSSMLGAPHAQHPSLSNALVAAFKRAQAHQRRGSIENQQQPLLAVKVEVEQLIISILDDPSVSRVMREAGFSSTQVKCNVEKAVSLEVCASNPTPGKPNMEGNVLMLSSSAPASPSPSSLTSQFGLPTQTNKPSTKPLLQVRNEDVMREVESLMNERRRNTVVVGECLASSEGFVRRAMEKVDEEETPEELKNLQLISLPLFSFNHLSKEEIDQKLGEIRCLVKSGVGRGAVLYVGDLKWIADYRAASSSQSQGRGYFCPVEHMVIELSRLVCGSPGEIRRLWLMGVATHQTYSKCKIGLPSLETIWGLHPLTIPSDSLGLSLSSESDHFSSKYLGCGTDWSSLVQGMEKQLTCCSNCSGNFQREVQSLEKGRTANHDHFTITLSTLPSWLRQHKDEQRKSSVSDQDYFQVRELCKKWNSFCSSFHRDHHHHPMIRKSLSFSSSTCSPSVSFSITSYDQHFSANAQPIHQTWPVIFNAPKTNLWVSGSLDDHHSWPSVLGTHGTGEQWEPKPADVRIVSNSNPSSASASSDTMNREHLPKYKEINAENLKTLCHALEQKVPWQKEIVSEVASTILQCRSGMVRRRVGNVKCNEPKEDTWLFFQGGDTEGKEKIARGLASLVFRSPTNFVSIGLSCYSSSRPHSTEDYRNKRSREESSSSYFERFVEELAANPHRVFFLEDIEQVDYYSHLGIKGAIERGCIRSSNGNEVPLRDAIVILSCETFDSRSRATSPIRQRSDNSCEDDNMRAEGEKETSPSVSLDLNISFEDCDEPSFDDIGLLECIDRRFILSSKKKCEHAAV